MRILHLGNPAVVPALRALGHDVRVASELCPLLVVPGRPVDVRLLHREIAPDAEAFLMVDTLGRQSLAYGVEEVPVPRVYWAIDVHMNFFWQRHYAGLFDLVLSAQKDYVPLLAAEGVPARWLPWGIDADVFHDPGIERPIDIAFVGVVDAHRPKRSAALAELGRRFRFETFGADATHRLSPAEMARIFASAKIVFNESVMGDLNFRTFEAMACGALLLTEHIDNGLCDLFIPGQHLATYDSETLIGQAERLLASPRERERVARAGAALVGTRHTMAARMATVTDWLAAGIPRRETRFRAAACFGVAAELTIARGLSDPPALLRLAAERLQAAVGEQDVESALALADLMLIAGRDDGALGILGVARAAEPTDPRAWLLASEIERGRGRAAEALTLARDGVAAADVPASVRRAALAALVDVDHPRARFALGLVLQAFGVPFVPGFARHIGVNLPRTALDYFQEALAGAPEARDVLEHVAALLEVAGRDEFAQTFRARQVRALPVDAEVRARFARTLARSYALGEGAHHARVARSLVGDECEGTPAEQAAAHREAGLALLQAGVAPLAADRLARALALAPSAAPQPRAIVADAEA
jgi:glycosyltransferase involved in cell wall biosynthesis